MTKESPCRFLDTKKKSIVECRAHNASSCPRKVKIEDKKRIGQDCWRRTKA
ncbi:MAG: hypothetical protein PHC39_05000 [Proteiniphilum sp.]|nr:hypothetical protein [Proteiniphilum sp.]